VSGAQDLPKLDAAVGDSGRPIPLDPAPQHEVAKSTEPPKPKTAVTRVAAKAGPPDQADEARDKHAPPAPGLPPTAATPAPELQPTPEPRSSERNPLHMDIQ
jgi:hypothetical protein